MKRSTLIAIIVIFISILGGGLLGFYFYINSKSVQNDTIGTRVQTGPTPFGTPSVDTSITLPGNASTTQPEQRPEITAGTQAEAPIPMLRKIYTEPVSGAAFFAKDVYATTTAVTETVFVANGTTTSSSTKIIKPAQSKIIGRILAILFVERATGHIFETATSSLELKKSSNTTVPKMYEASFVGPESLILRGLYGVSDSIQTIFGAQRLLTPTSTEKTLITKDLFPSLTQVVLSPSKNKIFTLQKPSPTGQISNPDGTSAITAFDSPFKEWIAGWPNERLITLTTKASGFTEGYMYTLNTTSKAVQKVMGGKKGLTTLMSPDANKVLFSESVSGSTYLSLYDIKEQTSRPLFFRTFAEKCIWSNQNADIVFCAVPQDIAFGDYPDAWYQGLIFFTDAIWKINTKTGETQLVTILSDLTTETIDAINPVLNQNDTFLLFNNKIDLSLWGLRLLESKKATTTTSTTPVTSTAPTAPRTTTSTSR